MKKLLSLTVAFILCICMLTAIACDNSQEDNGNNKPDDNQIFTITFESDGKIVSTQKVTDGKFDFPQDPAKDGYIFDGWYFDNDEWKDELCYSSVIIQNTTVFAKWIKISSTVTYDEEKSSLQNGEILRNAISDAQDETVVIVGQGTYDVTHKGNNRTNYDSNLVIENDNVRIQGDGEVVLVSSYTSGVENAQQTVTVKADNVHLKNLTVFPVENYAGRSKTIAVLAGDNVTIDTCTVYGTVYISSPLTGKYFIIGNTVKTFEEMQNTSISIANGAGSAMQPDEQSVISSNVCEGALLLLGVRDNAWDNNDITKMPDVTDNTFGSVYKQERDCYLLIGSTTKDSISKDNIIKILSQNEFSGKTGEFLSYDFEFYGTYYSYYY